MATHLRFTVALFLLSAAVFPLGQLRAGEANPPVVVNDLLSLIDLETAFDPATSTFTIWATFRNVSQETIDDPVFLVNELSGPACPCDLDSDFEETFDSDASSFELANSGDPDAGWAFNDICSEVLASPTGPGALRWGSLGDCLGSGSLDHSDRASTPRIGGTSCTLSFDYYLDYTLSPTDQNLVEIRLAGLEQPLLSLADGELSSSGEWISASTPIPASTPFRVDFLASVGAEAGTAGSGWIVDDVVIDCLHGPGVGEIVPTNLDDPFLVPDETFTHRFDIVLTTSGSVTFFVDVLGTVLVQPRISAPSTLDFGDVVLGAGSSLPLTIENIGSATLEVTSITSDHLFFVPWPTFATLEPGASETIEISFTPLELGSVETFLRIESNDPDHPAISVAISGNGSPPPLIQVLPLTLDSTLPVGGGESQELELSNAGEGSLVFSISALWAAEPLSPTALFINVDPAEGIVAPLDSTLIDVYFTATGREAGRYEAEVLVSSNDPLTPVVSVPATLTVTDAPNIQLPGPMTTIESSKDYSGPEATTGHLFSFPVPPVGGGILELTVEGNYETGHATASAEGTTLGSAGSTGLACQASSASFPLTTPLLAGLAANGSVYVEVVNSSDVDAACPTNSHTLRLNFVPELQTIDFGDLVLGQSIDQVLLIQNNGTELLQVTSIASDLPEFSPQPSLLSVPPGESASVTLTFVPSSADLFSGTLSISSNDPDDPTLEIAMQGVATSPNIVVSETELNFGVTEVGHSVDLALTIENSGTGTLEVSSITTGHPAFQSSADSLVLGPGEAETVVITFTPATTGEFSDTLTISSNDPDEAEIEVLLQGTSIAPPQIEVTPTVLTFGEVAVGASAELELIVRNLGSETLEVSSINSDDPAFSPSTSTLSVGSGGSEMISVTFVASTSGAVVSTLRLTSNDVDTPVLAVELIGVGAAPRVLVGRAAFASSIQPFTIAGGSTQHSIPVEAAPLGAGRVELVADGDFGGPTTWATLLIEGSPFGSVGESGFGCGSASMSVTVDAGELAAIFADGLVQVEVRNSQDVNAVCPINQHTVRLSFLTDLHELDFGHVLFGATTERSIGIENNGPASLEVGSITSDASEFTPLSTSMTVDPYTTETIVVAFAPPTVGLFTGMLSIATNDPTTPLVQMPMTGGGGAPSFMVLSPSALDSTLPSGGTELQTLTVTNNGESALEFSISAAWVGDPVSPTAVFVSADPSRDSVPANGSLDVDVYFLAADLPVGTYEATLQITSNDPVNPQLSVSAELTVLAAPHIQIPGGLFTQESVIDYQATGAATAHQLPTAPAVGGGILQLSAQGNYLGSTRLATVYAEGQLVGAAGNAALECSQISGSAFVSTGELARLTANGVIDVQVQNSSDVEASCLENRHTIRLVYNAALTRLVFGSAIMGSTLELPVTIQNNGTETLQLLSITSDLPEYLPSLTSAAVPAGGSRTLLVSFSPSGLGEFVASLGIVSNDPDEPLIEIILSGSGVAAGGNASHPIEHALPDHDDEDSPAVGFESRERDGRQSADEVRGTSGLPDEKKGGGSVGNRARERRVR